MLRKTLLSAVVAGVFAIALTSAQVPPQPQQPATGAGFISGHVVDAITGKPIAEATVMLNGRNAAAAARGASPPPALPQPVLTDSQGRFFFAALPAGLYTAQAAKTGFAAAPFGPIQLAQDEHVMDWTLKLAKFSSLAGTLRDETGDPSVGVDVSLFRRSVVNGRQTWQFYGRMRSDDRGAYRFGSLTAGDFVICACGRDPIPFDPLLLTTLGSEPVQLLNVAARALSMGADAVSLDSSLRTWAPMFYPNSTSLARATRISVAAGEDRAALDMNLTIVRATRVSGQIVGATGPVYASSMRLIPEADADAGMNVLSLSPMLAQPDGRFDFAPVPPGQYRLVVVHQPGLPAGGPSGTALGFAGARGATPPPVGATMSSPVRATVEPPQWASELVTVGDNGVSGLTVHLNKAASVTGRLQWIGAAPQPQPNVFNRITAALSPVSPSDPLASSGNAVGRFSPDGTFLIPGAVPGKYIINIQAVPGYPTLKSVMMGGTDITDLPLVVAERDLADIVVTYVDTPMASLTITVVSSPGSLGDDGSILVFPTDRKFWTESSAARRRFRQVTNVKQSSVTTGELPAGDYYAVAASALEAKDWMEVVKLETLAKRAQHVTVGDTGKATVEVRR